MSDEVSEYHPNRFSEVNLGRILQGKSYAHSHFTDVNGKNINFESFDFSYCVFTRAFFHQATFSDCKFIGAHFLDCNFRNANIRDCDFSYASFTGTRIATGEILNNLPSWPNVRRELLQILRRNAMSMGDYESEKVFVIRELDSEKEHYRKVWERNEPYYRNKYSRFQSWLHGLKLLCLQIDNFVWGHGERLLNALIALILFLCLISVFMALTTLPSIQEATVTDALDLFLIYLSYNLNLFLDLPIDSGIRRVGWIEWIVVVARYLAIGVIVAALYRRLAHR